MRTPATSKDAGLSSPREISRSWAKVARETSQIERSGNANDARERMEPSTTTTEPRRSRTKQRAQASGGGVGTSCAGEGGRCGAGGSGEGAGSEIGGTWEAGGTAGAIGATLSPGSAVPPQLRRNRWPDANSRLWVQTGQRQSGDTSW